MDLNSLFQDNKSWRIVHQLLIHLDSFKPLMEMRLSVLEDHIFFIKSIKPKDVTLEFWCVRNEMVKKTIPFYLPFMQTIANLLSFRRDDGVQLVSVLDLLIVFCIFMCGEWQQKAKFLFEWFNLNGQGLLEEDEHYLLVKRVSKCFQNLKLLGILELREDEAKYIAMAARIKYNKLGQGSFIPGLYFEDFLQWTLSNNECQLMYFFSRVLNRLCELLRTLENRTEKLVEIIKEKYEQKMDFLPVAIPQSLCPPKLISSSVFLVLKTNQQLSVCIDIQHIKSTPFLEFNSNFYIKLEKEIPLQPHHPHYEINHNIVDRNQNLHEKTFIDGLHCCSKYYCKTDVIVWNSKNNSPKNSYFLRIDIDQCLEQNFDYQIEISHEFVQYKPFRCRLPAIPQKDSIIESEQRILVFPASLNMQQFKSLLSSSPLRNEKNVWIFTGAISDCFSVRTALC
jgi:hypothetical protein